MTRKALGLFFGIALVLCGCGKTNEDVINENRARFQPKRQQLKALAQKLPGPGGGVPDKGRLSLSPLPIFDRKGRKYNTEILAAEQVADPDAKPAHDLNTSGPLLDCLLWTGPQNPMSSSALQQSASDDFVRSFEEALVCRYVVVYRQLDHKPPVVLSENNYQPGSMTLEVLLADLESKEVLTGFRISARSAPRIEYVSKEGEDKLEAARRWAESSLWSDARRQLAQALTERTGGTFAFDP